MEARGRRNVYVRRRISTYRVAAGPGWKYEELEFEVEPEAGQDKGVISIV